ncbi:CRISPR-associated protein Cas7, partial [Streptococcus mutans]|nr:CRISPR-associated protein Cas7 [Streptococcus mutans]
VTIKILNNLYQYDKKINYPILDSSPLEIKFLRDND